jgi:hypothetical protein
MSLLTLQEKAIPARNVGLVTRKVKRHRENVQLSTITA